MKAVTITQVQKVQVMEYSMPEVGPNDVLIQIKACALCTMEQRIYLGKKDVGGYPVIAGHEASGIVVQVGQQVKHCKVGDHVVSTDPYCGTCYYCRTGRASQCHSGIADAVYKRLDGAINMVGYLAEYIAVDQCRVIVVSDALPFEQAALTEPLACCLHSVNKSRDPAGGRRGCHRSGRYGPATCAAGKKERGLCYFGRGRPGQKGKSACHWCG